MFIHSLAALAVSVFSHQALATDVKCEDAVADVRAKVQKAFSGSHASIILAQGNWVLVKQSFGTAAGNAVNENTEFLLGSVSKTLDAATTARLAQAGKFSYTQPILPYLPASYVAQLPSTWQAITVERLIHHTSGIEDYMNWDSNADQAVADKFLASPHTFAELIGSVPHKLRFVTGKNLNYSNTNYLILAQILAQSLGQPYSELLDEQVVRPLGLTHTGLTLKTNPALLGSSGIDLSNMTGLGNSYSTAADLWTFLKALDDNSLFTDEWKTRMESQDPGCSDSDRCWRYGWGFSLRPTDIPGNPYIFHEGHLAHVSALVAKIPALQVNIAMVSDIAGFAGEDFARTTLQTLVSAGCFAR